MFALLDGRPQRKSQVQAWQLCYDGTGILSCHFCKREDGDVKKKPSDGDAEVTASGSSPEEESKAGDPKLAEPGDELPLDALAELGVDLGQEGLEAGRHPV